MLKASLIEFGNNSYKNTSTNDICKNIIYHNFKNKDDLY